MCSVPILSLVFASDQRFVPANDRVLLRDDSLESGPSVACQAVKVVLGRCLTLEDTVEFFNLVFDLHLYADEKNDLVAYVRCL